MYVHYFQMARTKQTARKVTGGKPPRAQLPSRPRQLPVNMHPTDIWKMHLQQLMPKLHEKVCTKIAKRIFGFGALIIFDRMRNMQRNPACLGKIEYAAEMRRVFTAARNTTDIDTSKTCHEFFKKLRKEYKGMFGLPMSRSKKLELNGTLQTKTRQEVYLESIAAQPTFAGGGMVGH